MKPVSIKLLLIAAAIAAVVSGLCANAGARDYWHKPRSPEKSDDPDKSKENKCEKCIVIDHSRYGGENRDNGAVWEICRSLSLSPGDEFYVRIKNTLPSKFDYTIAGIKSPPPDPGADDSKLNKPQSYDLIHVHDPKYGGYIVTITAKEGAADSLGNVRIIISVKTMEWKIGFAGGFTGSTLTEKKYGIVTENADDMRIVRDVDSEDKVRLGIASFVHLWHSSADWFAWSFGLGLESGSNIVYYTGPSYRFGDKGALTLGLSLGSVSTLPAGTGEDTPVTDANILNDLPMKNRLAFFVGISYSFIGGSEAALSKPFEGQSGSQ